MNKRLRFDIQEAASFFLKEKRTENEEYLLNIILQLGREYNSLIDKHNRLIYENEYLNRKLSSRNKTGYPYGTSIINRKT